MGSFKLVLVGLIALAAYCKAKSNVICYYDSRSHLRDAQGKFAISDLEPALDFCTHLVYGFAAIKEDTFKLCPLNEQFDVIKDNYRHVTDLKRRYPRTKFLLSVGGNADVSGDGAEKNLKYRTLLESSTHRLAFVNSAYTLIKGFGFDGLDLAWEFPETKPKKIRSKLGSIWHSVKKTVGAVGVVDDKEAEHREQFVGLVRELKTALKPEGLLLSVTVLPNVNSTVYYDPRAIAPNVDWINLQAYDFHTPARNPKEADYPAPLYELEERRPDENANAQVQYWLNNGAPSAKIVLGIPTHARAWKMDDESDINGIPPLHVDGAAEPGQYTKDGGLLSFPEACLTVTPATQTKHGKGNVNNNNNLDLKIVKDSSKRKGTFAFKLADENNNGGVWIGYEDTDTAGNKASYARAKGLGGISISDLSLDDFRGQCGSTDKYDILRAAVAQL